MKLISFRRNSESDDQELLREYLENHNPETLGELYNRYIHLVYGICLKYFKHRENAMDAVIDIYEKIQNSIHNHEVKSFKSWLYVVSKNHCLMELRKFKPRQNIFVSDSESFADLMENEHELHPIDKENEEFLEKKLAKCIEKLKAEQKKCIHMFYFDNQCYREISEILNIDEKKVKSYIQNGKRNVKICLEIK